MRDYVGSELELFAAAANWKRYIARALAPFVAGHVLEVGAGIGANIPHLCNARVAAWTALEPDPQLASKAAERVARSALPVPCEIVVGTTETLAAESRFDAILYIDVIEHIADDRAELARASAHLNPGAHLVVLAPAHPFLFSAFDAAIGHFRRYGGGSLAALAPPDCRLRTVFMLDMAGLSASLANAMLLRAARPSAGQIRLWDRFLVPASRILDAATGRRFGKTVVAVWRR